MMTIEVKFYYDGGFIGLREFEEETIFDLELDIEAEVEYFSDKINVCKSEIEVDYVIIGKLYDDDDDYDM